MQNHQRERWVEIVASLTLARSILASAICDIDDIVSEIDAGRIQTKKRSSLILENAIKDLMSSSEAIGNVAVDIPESFLTLKEPTTQHCCAACRPNHTDYIQQIYQLRENCRLTF